MFDKVKLKGTTIQTIVNRIKSENSTLLSVKLENVLLPRTVVFDPSLEIKSIEEGVVDMNIRMKKGYGQETAVDTFANVMYGVGLGTEFKEENFKEKYQGANLLERTMLKNTKFSDLENSILNLTLNTNNVYKQEFTISGTPYTLYTIEDKAEFVLGEGETEDFTTTLYLLFKDKEYDKESFLGSLINKELSKSDRQKVLNLMTEPDLTGKLITMLSNNDTTGKTIPKWSYYQQDMTTDTRLDYLGDNQYLVRTLSTYNYINMDEVISLTVEKERDLFKVSFITNTNKFTLLYG